MNVLLDTHLLLWAAENPRLLPRKAFALLEKHQDNLVFSVVSLWEIGIKLTLGRSDFRVNPSMLRRALLVNGYRELEVTAAHVLEVPSLPLLHGDPFDRLLIAQARIEGLTLFTVDEAMEEYGSPVRCF